MSSSFSENNFTNLNNKILKKTSWAYAQPPILNIMTATIPWGIMLAGIVLITIFNENYSYVYFFDAIGFIAYFCVRFLLFSKIRTSNTSKVASADRAFNRKSLAVLCTILNSCNIRFFAATLIFIFSNVQRASGIGDFWNAITGSIGSLSKQLISNFNWISFFIVLTIGVSTILLIKYPKDVSVGMFDYKVRFELKPLPTYKPQEVSRPRVSIPSSDGFGILHPPTVAQAKTPLNSQSKKAPATKKPIATKKPTTKSVDVWEQEIIKRKSRK